MGNIIYLDDKKTWPEELINFLTNNHDIFYSWEQIGRAKSDVQVSPKAYDAAVYGLEDVLSNYSLHGYHCTRLTEKEVSSIASNGMVLQNASTLNHRIDDLVNNGLITFQIANRLKKENEADDKGRARMLWFCFYPPYIATQYGIERLFRSWGGEALYNSHEGDPETGIALRKIGIPYIVEAIVPISSLGMSYLSTKIVRQYLINCGLKKPEPTEHEGYSHSNIPAANIIDIIKYPSSKFLTLTQCDTWEPLL